MANDVVPSWLFGVVFAGFAIGIFIMYRWLDHWRKK
jgi:hypothetical protein